MIGLIPKFLSRNTSKTLGFIRDISIPIMLFLSVVALITTLNVQIINLVNLGGQDSYLTLHSTNSSSLASSQIPADIQDQLIHPNVKRTLPTHYFFATIQGSTGVDNNFSTIAAVQAVNLSELAIFWPRYNFDSNLLNFGNMSAAVIGSVLANNLQITLAHLPLTIEVEISSNLTGIFVIENILFGQSPYSISLVITEQSYLSLLNFNQPEFYSFIYIQLRDRFTQSKTTEELTQQIQRSKIVCECQLLTTSGTSIVLESIIIEILNRINLFYLILTLIILVRLYQAIHWMTIEYRYEANLLKIIGHSTGDSFKLFFGLGLVLGNLALLLGIAGGIFISFGSMLFLSLVFGQPVVSSLPNELQILIVIGLSNSIFFVASFYPAFSMSRKVVESPITREIR